MTERERILSELLGEKDIPDHVIAYGNPCRVIRENK